MRTLGLSLKASINQNPSLSHKVIKMSTIPLFFSKNLRIEYDIYRKTLKIKGRCEKEDLEEIAKSFLSYYNIELYSKVINSLRVVFENES